MNLNEPRISYIILSSDNIEAVESYLLATGFDIIYLLKNKGKNKKAILAYYDVDDKTNDSLREYILFLLEEFKIKNAIIKYKFETKPKLITVNGEEIKLELKSLTNEFDNDIPYYNYNQYFFYFVREKEYFSPTKKEDLKLGMVVEYLNKNEWIKYKIKNPSIEYDRLFKLLMKYNKVRIPL